jgi:hypothetical protein
MKTILQRRALNKYPKRLNERGMARFEVLGRDADRELIRAIAKRLAGDDSDSERIRAIICEALSTDRCSRGGILDALRRSPMVGAELDLRRT